MWALHMTTLLDPAALQGEFPGKFLLYLIRTNTACLQPNLSFAFISLPLYTSSNFHHLSDSTGFFSDCSYQLAFKFYKGKDGGSQGALYNVQNTVSAFSKERQREKVRNRKNTKGVKEEKRKRQEARKEGKKQERQKKENKGKGVSYAVHRDE